MSKRDFDDLLRAARADQPASAADASRIAAKLAGKVEWDRALPDAAVTALEAESAYAASSGPTSRVPARGGHLWKVVAGIASTVIAGVTVHSIVTKSSSPDVGVPPAASLAPAEAPPSLGAEKKPEIPEPNDVPVLGDPSLLPTAPAAPRTTSAAAASTAASLDAELALLARTSAALRARDPRTALALTAEHDRKFPHGALRPELAAQRILALSALGRHAEACSAATKFAAENPSSPLLPQVRTACDDQHPLP